MVATKIKGINKIYEAEYLSPSKTHDNKPVIYFNWHHPPSFGLTFADIKQDGIKDPLEITKHPERFELVRKYHPAMKRFRYVRRK